MSQAWPLAGPGKAAEGASPRTRPRLPPSWTATSRRARWRRARLLRAVCALLGGVAVWLSVDALRPEPPAVGEPVVVAVRDVPLGAVLSLDDLAPQARPAQQRPAASAVSVAEVVGRVAAAPISAGEVLTHGRVLGPGLLAGLPGDRVAVSVPLVEPGILGGLRAGDRVDVYAAGDGRRVASGATVLSVAGGSGSVLGSDPPGHVIVAVTSEQAGVVAAASSGQAGLSGFLVAVRAG